MNIQNENTYLCLLEDHQINEAEAGSSKLISACQSTSIDVQIDCNDAKIILSEKNVLDGSVSDSYWNKLHTFKKLKHNVY